VFREQVAELMVTRCIREAVALAWVVLWVLSTRVGTLLLCGRLCVAGGFPYVRRFADMPPERREAALQRWNRVRWLFPLRIAFAIVKILCHYVFYAMVPCSFFRHLFVRCLHGCTFSSPTCPADHNKLAPPPSGIVWQLG